MCKFIPFRDYEYYLACERDCNPDTYSPPTDYIQKKTFEDVDYPGRSQTSVCKLNFSFWK